MSQGVQLGSKLAGLGPRLVAGEARDGGGGRNSSSGDQMASGGHLRDAGARPRRVVAAAGPKMAGVVTGVDRGGRRSSGELGVDATVAGEARARHLRALRSAGRKLSTTARPLGGRRHVGGGHRRRRVSAELGAVAVVLESENGKGEEEEELTGSRSEQTASSGRRRRRRIDGGGPRWPRRGKASGRRFGASPAA